MRYQKRPYTCGPSAIVNAARALGIRVAERRVAKLAGSAKHHETDDWQMLEAIRGIGLIAEPISAENRSAAWAFVKANVNSGRPTILAIDNWSHWVAVIGVCGDRVIIADGTNTSRNHQENGILSLGRLELLRRWMHKGNGEHYGIAIGRKR